MLEITKNKRKTARQKRLGLEAEEMMRGNESGSSYTQKQVSREQLSSEQVGFEAVRKEMEEGRTRVLTRVEDTAARQQQGRRLGNW